MSEPLLHYAESRIERLEPREYKKDNQQFKPVGFWVSVSEDWKQWCEGEDFGLERLTVCHEITLADSANILRLSTPEDLDQFTKRFALPDSSGWPGRRFGERIDWEGVRCQYQGIIIAPYCWERRLAEHTFWYYPWDCASGCIWDLGAIVSIEACQMPVGVRENPTSD